MVITRSDLGQAAAGSVFTTTALFLIGVTVVQLGADVGIVRWLPLHFAVGDDHNVKATMRAAFVPVLILSWSLASECSSSRRRSRSCLASRQSTIGPAACVFWPSSCPWPPATTSYWRPPVVFARCGRLSWSIR